MPMLEPYINRFKIMHFCEWLSEWVSRGLTSHWTLYRSFWDYLYRLDNPTNSLKALKEASWPLIWALIPPEPLHRVTIWTVGNRLQANHIHRLKIMHFCGCCGTILQYHFLSNPLGNLNSGRSGPWLKLIRSASLQLVFDAAISKLLWRLVSLCFYK